MAANTKLNLEAFLGFVRQSGLIDGDALKKALKEIRELRPELDDARDFADLLVSRNLVTRWQADKLLQGKHRGFFLGKYRLLSHLGTGGMSSVYLAEHVLMRRRVAIKVLPKSRVNDSSYLERFHREARAVASLDHRNIVRAYDVDQEDQNHFLVMEYVPGQSLHELVTKRDRLDYVSAAEYARQAADGLHHAHRMGMVHRDIKPGNLLLDDKGTIKLLDLGLARFFDEDEDHSLTRQHDERILGTADYLSPEQALDSHSADIRSDVYSLGCTLYFFLTGHPPFPEGTLAQRLLAHQTREPPPLENERPDAPPGLVAILSRMTARRPDQRFQSARDVSQALLQWLTEYGGAAWAGMNPLGAGGSSLIVAGAAEPGQPPSSSSDVLGSAGPSSSSGKTSKSWASAKTPAGSAAQAAEPELAAFLSTLAAQNSAPATHAETRREPNRIQAHQAVSIDSAATRNAATATPVGSDSGSMHQAAFASSDRQQPVEGNFPGSGLSLDGSVGASVQTAIPSMAPESHAAAARRRSKRSPRRLVIVTVAIALALVALAVSLLPSRLKTGSSGKSGEPKKPAVTARESPKNSPVRSVAVRRDFPVGPAAEFKTIGAALSEARKQTAAGRRAPLTIRVAAGQTYAERIEIDGAWPGSVRIVAEDGPAPVLAPPGPDPIVVLHGSGDDLNNFQLQGFHLDATGKKVAARLIGWIPGARLSHLKLTGFAETGLYLDGAQTYGAEDARIVLDSLSFGDASPDATGILLGRRKDEDPAHVRIKRCRFVSPLAAGIRFAGDMLDVEIEESIFFRTRVGVHLDGSARVWRDLTFAFNTFYENDRGIVFAEMPAAGTHGLAFHNNLFVKGDSSDAVVEKGYDAKRFLAMYRTSPAGVGYNWTTRKREATSQDGELESLFATGHGRIGATGVQFQSHDPEAINFLAPTESSAHRQPGTLLDRRKFGAQIGAVR